MQCSKFIAPANPKFECKYGTEVNVCNKTSCLKGPDEVCQEEFGMIAEHCAPGLMCCGICVGGHENIYSRRICEINSIASKRASSTPTRFMKLYQQRQEERRRLQQIQLQQQQEQEDERQRMQLMSLPRDFINFKSPVDRYPFYPFNNNIEYSANNDD